MRLLPWEYGIRNLLRRPLRTSLTALGLMLVVFLLLLVVSFLRGLEQSLARSGDPEVMMLHNVNAAENLENSSISDEVTTLARTEFAPYLVTHFEQAAVSPELTMAVRIGDGPGQLGLMRGVEFNRVFLVRRQVRILEGRLPGNGEILVGVLAGAKLGLPPQALTIGQPLIIEGRRWTISGHFAAAASLLDAEIWCGLEELKSVLKRPNDVSIVAMRFDPKGDRRLQNGAVDYFCRNRRADLELMGSREADYYASLKQHYGHMRALVWLLVALVALAGACGAINTMYAAVAGRVREFAALQAVGFPRRAIVLSLFQESVILAAAATLAASSLTLALMRGTAIRFTMGAFTLELDQTTLLIGCGVGLGLGVLGALPPAMRALKMPIADALKAV